MKKNSYKKVNGKNEWIVEELRGLKYNNPFFHHSKRWKYWVIDNAIPIFKADGREYINDLVYVGE